MTRPKVGTMRAYGCATAAALAVLLCTAAPQTALSAAAHAVKQDDRGEIENLLAAAVFAYDRHDGAGFAKYFTPNGRLITVASQLHPDAGVTYQGPSQLGDFVTKNIRGRAEMNAASDAPAAGTTPSAGAAGARGNGITHHIVTSNYIRIVDATHAKHWGYWLLSGGANIAGVYEDELEKQNGKWLISVRKILYTPLDPDAVDAG